jgi:hypothetical protein
MSKNNVLGESGFSAGIESRFQDDHRNRCDDADADIQGTFLLRPLLATGFTDFFSLVSAGNCSPWPSQGLDDWFG